MKTLNEKVKDALSRAAPCPGCGSRNLIANRSLIRRHHWFVECWACHWCGPTRWTLKRAIKAWEEEADVHG